MLFQSSIADDKSVQIEFVDQLISYCAMEEAAKWAKYFNLDKSSLPSQIVDMVDSAPE